MSSLGHLSLRDRRFEVSAASISRHDDGTWSVDIETNDRVFDGERWGPSLYHQGLRLPAATPEALDGTFTAWTSLRDAGYPHPELGLMCVFGHHEVYECRLAFGPFRDGSMFLNWSGLCEVYWDDEFAKDVPFTCECRAEIRYPYPHQ